MAATPVSSSQHLTASSGDSASQGLARRLGLFDATMIVMGGIVGAGIFINPYVVAQQVHTPTLILAAWIFGGLIAMAGAFVYAELASRMPAVGGQYAYMREAYHPGVAFLYGWALLLVIQTGGMAAVAITFGKYFVELTHIPISSGALAALALGILTLINCFGVRAGSTVQSSLMVMKIVIIAALVICGAIFLQRPSSESHAIIVSGARPSLLVFINRRIWSGHGAGHIFLRRISDGQFHRWRSSRTAQKSSARINARRRRSNRALRKRELYLRARSRRGRSRQHNHSGFRSYAHGARPARRNMDRAGHHNFCTGISKPMHPHCPARLFCDGRRRRIFSWRRMAQSSNARAGHRDRSARNLGNRHRAFRPLRTNIKFRQPMDLTFFGLSGLCIFIFRWRASASTFTAR